MRLLSLIPLSILLAAFPLTPEAKAERIALVIGVDDYDSPGVPDLDGAVHDAKLMAATLERMPTPFKVILLENPGLNDTLDGIDNFMNLARESECALFFFAGHGIEYHGENFLLTSDSDIELDVETSVEATKRRLRRKMLSLDTVMDEIELTGSDLKLLVLDACRDNPIPAADSSGKTRSLGSARGLARVSAPLGMLVSYSADAGEVANDGLFTEILTTNLAEPGMSVMEVFAKTREEVHARSRERNEQDARYNIQLPAEYNKLGLKGIKFVFNAPDTAPVAPPETMPFTPPTPGDLTVNPRSLPAETFINSVGIRMEPVPGGKFLMGDSENSGHPDEFPVREVEISPFHLSATEITQKMWMAFSDLTLEDLRRAAGFTGNQFYGEGDDFPVYYVSYDDAVSYCRALTAAEREAGKLPSGFLYRLPTEAEWEYACRAGSREVFTDEPGVLGEIGGYNGAIRIGSKKPNAFGLFDMQGNVWEWCLDFYQPDYSALGTVDPKGPDRGKSRVFRGGSWLEESEAARPSTRGFAAPDFRHRTVGFRVALARE